MAATGGSKTLGKATLQVLPAAEKAMRAMEQALAHIDDLRAVAHKWEESFGVLKRGARAAADDGAPMLHATLFERPGRTNGKNHKLAPPAPQPSVTPDPSPTPHPEPAAS